MPNLLYNYYYRSKDSDEMNNKLGKVLINLRKEKDLTQKELAEALHTTDKSISRWECGTGRPSLEMMYEISEYFGVLYTDLIAARVSDKHEDDKIVEKIVDELSGAGKKRMKKIKIGFIISLVLILVLIGIFIFSNSYNRFKVYKVYGESNSINFVSGMYIETKMRDVLYFGNLRIKDIEVKDTDIISVDLYIIENNEEIIIKNYSTLNEIYFILSEQDNDIDDLSDYFDNAYLRVSITDDDGKTEKYEAKLEFVLDFSNNKIYYDDNFIIEEYNYELTNYSVVDVESVLIDNGFKKSNDNMLFKNTKTEKISYRIDTKVLNYSYEKNGFRYKYQFRLNDNILEVNIYDENLSIIQDYEFDITNNKMNCKVGSCSGYEEVMEILDKNILYLLKQ